MISWKYVDHCGFYLSAEAADYLKRQIEKLFLEVNGTLEFGKKVEIEIHRRINLTVYYTVVRIDNIECPYLEESADSLAALEEKYLELTEKYKMLKVV